MSDVYRVKLSSPSLKGSALRLGLRRTVYRVLYFRLRTSLYLTFVLTTVTTVSHNLLRTPLAMRSVPCEGAVVRDHLPQLIGVVRDRVRASR